MIKIPPKMSGMDSIMPPYNGGGGERRGREKYFGRNSTYFIHLYRGIGLKFYDL